MLIYIHNSSLTVFWIMSTTKLLVQSNFVMLDWCCELVVSKIIEYYSIQRILEGKIANSKLLGGWKFIFPQQISSMSVHASLLYPSQYIPLLAVQCSVWSSCWAWFIHPGNFSPFKARSCVTECGFCLST